MENLKLENFFKKYNSDKDIYYDLMQYKVRDILLVSTMYEAFILEQEERLFEQIFGEYSALNLTSIPRITSVISVKDALEELGKRNFNLIILMMRYNEKNPFELSKIIKGKYPRIPILLLLNENTDINSVSKYKNELSSFDNVFVWNGDSKIFLAMIKYIEDKKNIKKDTKIGMVRVILLVENSIRYYSRYLPILYSQIFKQTQRLISDELYDDMDKILRMRARPKIIMVSNYEAAIRIINKYKEYLLCVISDVEFNRKKILDKSAGIRLIKHVKNHIPDLPCLIQSSESSNRQKAYEINASFLDKKSFTLEEDINDYMIRSLGFGDFIFRDKTGKKISRAANLEELEAAINVLPTESIAYHANRNHFSAWLMARGEINIAKNLQKAKISDFNNLEEMREDLIKTCKRVQSKKIMGKVINFEPASAISDNYIIRLANGSLGGKGRGIAFMNAILQNIDLSDEFEGVEVKIPITVVIGTEEFEKFIENNNILKIVSENYSDDELKLLFLSSELSSELMEKLRVFLYNVTKPLAIRSSGIFEDSLTQRFSGVYSTYLIPNNDKDFEVRLKQVREAIILVYYSIFCKSSRSYFKAVNHKPEEEKMSVIIEEVVGTEYNGKYYPNISGSAQSYNYYPVSYLKPEDGISVIGVGLGSYVLEGEKAFRFCPKYPEMNMTSPIDQLKNTQTEFYAIDLNKVPNLLQGENASVSKYSILDASNDGSIKHIASVWDNTSQRLRPGLFQKGPIVINFDYILKYNYFPLAKVIQSLLDTVEFAMGTPVEIEFAIKMTPESKKSKAQFYLLQIKPLLREISYHNIDFDFNDKENAVLYCEKSMGNGEITDIYDVIYIPQEKFDKGKTVEMANEIEKINDKMRALNKKYVLIGPGRWGTRDRWIGIPVNWGQISNAQVIVEYSMDNFMIDPSLGSHFFHNVISMNVGYFSIKHTSKSEFINWEWIDDQKNKESFEFFNHIICEKPLTVKMDGKNGKALILHD